MQGFSNIWLQPPPQSDSGLDLILRHHLPHKPVSENELVPADELWLVNVMGVHLADTYICWSRSSPALSRRHHQPADSHRKYATHAEL